MSCNKNCFRSKNRKKYNKKKRFPKLRFEGRFQYLNKGKIKNRLHKNEKIMLDGAHAEIDAKNLSAYLKSLKVPVYGVWAMMKNKEPNLFIKQFKNVFKKIVAIPIENENGSMKANDLYQIAIINNLNVEKS